jgi:hypothetical protein
MISLDGQQLVVGYTPFAITSLEASCLNSKLYLGCLCIFSFVILTSVHSIKSLSLEVSEFIKPLQYVVVSDLGRFGYDNHG